MDNPVLDVSVRLLAVLALVLANGFFVAAEFAHHLGAQDADRSAARRRQPHGAPGAARARESRSVHRRHAARHHDGQPGARLDRRARARVAARAAAATAARADLRRDGPHDRGRDRVHRSSPLCTSCSASSRRRPSRCSIPSRSSLVVAKPTELFLRVFHPFIRALNGMGWAVVRMFGMKAASGHGVRAFRGRAEDAGDGEPAGGRARRGRGADAPPRVSLRRVHGGRNDGAAHRDDGGEGGRHDQRGRRPRLARAAHEPARLSRRARRHRRHHAGARSRFARWRRRQPTSASRPSPAKR